MAFQAQGTSSAKCYDKNVLSYFRKSEKAVRLEEKGEWPEIISVRKWWRIIEGPPGHCKNFTLGRIENLETAI